MLFWETKLQENEKGTRKARNIMLQNAFDVFVEWTMNHLRKVPGISNYRPKQ